MQRQARGRLGVGVLFLAAQVFRIGLDNIPPVTLGFLAFNTAVYLRLVPLVRSAGAACASYYFVWKRGQWKRLLFSSFYHLDDMHLYFNMASFIWKGTSLERRYGKRKFFIIIAVFALLTQVTMLGLNRALSIALLDQSYLRSCAAGFSAVIFGLKVITTRYMWEDSVSVVGFPVTVPAQMACWVELILIQILVPNASFTGHLAGILVGLAFVKGPLERIINLIDRKLSGHSLHRGQKTSYTYRSGRLGTGDRGGSSGRRPNDNGDDPALQEAIRLSLYETQTRDSSRMNGAPPSYGWNIPDDDPCPDYALRERLRSQGTQSRGGVDFKSFYPTDGTSKGNTPYPVSDNINKKTTGWDSSQMPPYPMQMDQPHGQATCTTLPYPPADAELPYATPKNGIYPSINDLEYQNYQAMPSAPPIEEVEGHSIGQRSHQNTKNTETQSQPAKRGNIFEVD